MIRKLFATAFVFCLGAAAAYYALGHHIVRTTDNVVVVPKQTLELADTYSDIRQWTIQDFADHPKVTNALKEHGHGELVTSQSAGSIGDKIGDKIKETIGDLLD